MPDFIEMHSGCRDHGWRDAFAQEGKFPLPGDKPRYPRDRLADILHVRLDVYIDLDARSVRGSVAHTLTPINDGLRSLELDAVELEIGGVRLASGEELSHGLGDGRLRIDLGREWNAGEELTVVVDFSGGPRRGLYFIAPDEHYPEKRLEAWSQGQDEDSRHWFPCYDYPNELATSEVRVTVREPFTVISNGRLESVEPGPGTRTFHWRQDVPHVTYLTSICVGEFGEVREEWDGIPVTYHVPPGREEDARAVFGRTPEMLRLFSEKTGVRYPYAKYAQVVVQDFIFGGMENVSATTLTETALYDHRARIDQDADRLISHELAHQWFGDLLTCRDWSHGWLNEGFATFFEQVWTEHDKGRDEYLYELRGEMDSYLREASSHYRRPIVCNVYANPIDLFDRHLYEKGGIVLNMLHRMLGESLFWKGVRRYVITNRSANVVTADLQKAFELATGRNLDWFFDQWVYGAGHPQLKASYEWDEDAKTARVSLKQTQSGDQVAQAFRLPLTIDFRLESGERPSFQVEMTEREQTFHLRPGAKPKQVRIDPGGQTLKEIELDLSEEMLRDLLQWNDDVFTRVDAARALGKKGSREATAALGRSLREDAFWGMQAEAAKALGALRTAAALDELLASTGIAHPKARRAVMTALGEFREERAAEALEGVIDLGDESYYVEAAAAAAIGKTRSGRALGALERALAKPSFAEVIRSHALAGLGELRDERGVALCIDWSRWGRPNPVRGAAVASLGKLGEWVSEARKSEIVDHVTRLLDDPWLRTRLSAVGACQELKEERALPHLDRVAESDLDGRVVRAAREAARAIRAGKDRGDELKKLRGEVEQLQEENRVLRDRLDKVEARLTGGGG